MPGSAHTTIPPAEELLARAAALGPALRERAAETSRRRAIPPETIADIQQRELFQILQPRVFGGFELDFEIFASVAIELGRADGSAGWVYAVVSIHNMLLAHFDPAAQADVWGLDRQTMMAASYAPTGKAVRVDGGYRLSGRWSFLSGIDHSRWLQLCAVRELDDGRRERLMAIVPTVDCEIIDDWHVLGLCGTGSKSIAVDGVLVPPHRVVAWTDLRDATSPGAKSHGSPLYRIPVWSIFPYTLASPGVGIAQGAVERYIEQMRTYRSVQGADVSRLQSIQLRLAEASALAESAELLARAGIRATMDAALAGQPLSRELRARNRRNHGYCVAMAKRAVELIFASTGGRGLYDSSELQRSYRDIQALSGHIATNWDVAGSAYGLMMLTDELPDFLY